MKNIFHTFLLATLIIVTCFLQDHLLQVMALKKICGNHRSTKNMFPFSSYSIYAKYDSAFKTTPKQHVFVGVWVYVHRYTPHNCVVQYPASQSCPSETTPSEKTPGESPPDLCLVNVYVGNYVCDIVIYCRYVQKANLFQKSIAR